jgi:phage shock protein PspC (stress-responsive transcriptional regulator)
MNDVNGASGSTNEPGTVRRLERKLDGRWIAGVCAGVADYFGVDVTIVRAVFAVLACFSGLGALIYVVGWALLPEEGDPTSILEKLVNKTGS